MAVFGALALTSQLRVPVFQRALPDLPPTWRTALHASSSDGLSFEVQPRPLMNPADTQHPGLDDQGRRLLYHYDAATGELVLRHLDSGERQVLGFDGDCDPLTNPPHHCVDPCWVPLPDGTFRLYWVRMPDTEGQPLGMEPTEIRSARSTDGITWVREPGVRFSGRGVTDPDVVPVTDGGYRLYYSSAFAPQPTEGVTVPGLYSAYSEDGLVFEAEPGQRLPNARASATVPLPTGGYRTYYHYYEVGIRSARSADGLRFEPEPGFRVPPEPLPGRRWLGPEAPGVIRQPDGSLWMVFSATREPLFPRNLVAAWWYDRPAPEQGTIE